jgi:hypothetical protein
VDFKGKLISVLSILTAVIAAVGFIFFSVSNQLKRGADLYKHYQDSLSLVEVQKQFAHQHPKSREDWMRNEVDSAKWELDSLFMGDTATRESHRDRYYSHLEVVDSLLYNDPAHGDDVPTPYTEYLDSVEAHKPVH